MRRGADFAFVAAFGAALRMVFDFTAAALAAGFFVLVFAMRHPFGVARRSSARAETGVRHPGGQCFVHDRHAIARAMPLFQILYWLAGCAIICLGGFRVVTDRWPWDARP